MKLRLLNAKFQKVSSLYRNVFLKVIRVHFSVKVIVRHNHDEFSPTFSSQHSSAVDAVLECDRKYEDLFKLLDEANPPNIETIPVLDPEKEVSDDSITYHLPNVQFEQEEMFEQPVSPENPLSESDLTIPTIKGNFDGKKNVRFTGTHILNHYLQICTSLSRRFHYRGPGRNKSV